MYNPKFVFSQLTGFLNHSKFNRIVRTYDDDRYVKHFICWNQLLVMIFGQLCNRESLRDLIEIIEAHRSKCYYLGFGKNVSKSNLAYANMNRDCRIFEEFSYFLVAGAGYGKTDIFNLGGNVYAFDSTTIDLYLSVFWWARFRKYKAGMKVHFLYDVETQIPVFFYITDAARQDCRAMDEIPNDSGSYYVFDKAYNDFKRLHRLAEVGATFVVRSKKNLKFRIIRWKRRLLKNVLSDCIIELTGYYPSRYYPEL